MGIRIYFLLYSFSSLCKALSLYKTIKSKKTNPAFSPSDDKKFPISRNIRTLHIYYQHILSRKLLLGNYISRSLAGRSLPECMKYHIWIHTIASFTFLILHTIILTHYRP